MRAHPPPPAALAPSLRALHLDGNRLTSLSPLAPLTRLEALSASRNRVRGLQGLAALGRLQRLDAAGNAIERLEDVGPLAGLSLLGELDLRGNALQLAMGARLHAVRLLPRLARLDGLPVAPAERVAAGDAHGEGAGALRGVRARWFPGGELDDGGGAVPPAAAGARPRAAAAWVGAPPLRSRACGRCCTLYLRRRDDTIPTTPLPPRACAVRGRGGARAGRR